MPTKQNLLAVAGVLGGALVWGLIWYPYRVLQTAGVSGPLATLLSYLLAILCGAGLLRRMWFMRPRFDAWALLLVLSAGWANFGYVLGMLQGEVMRVLLLFYLAPLWTLLFAYLLLGEQLTRYGYLVLALSLNGALIMLWEPSRGWPLPDNASEWFGLSAGMGFALSNVVTRKAVHLSIEAKSLSLWLGTAGLTLPFLLWKGDLPLQLVAIQWQSWLLLVLMGLTLCATSFAVQFGVTHLSASRAVLLFQFELVVAALAAYVLAGESLRPRDWCGAALIAGASLLSGKLGSERRLG